MSNRYSQILLIILLFLYIYSISIKKRTSKKGSFINIQLSAKESKITHLSLISLNKILKPFKYFGKNKKYTEYISKKVTTYSGQILVGTPPQYMEVVFDTGSSNIILTSTNCDSYVCNIHKKYNPVSSISHSNISHLENPTIPIVSSPSERDKVNISFGTGEAKCFIGKDNVCIGEDVNHLLCSENNIILEAYDLTSNPFLQVEFDGIIGLSFNHLSVSNESNFLEMIYEKGKIKKRLFSFYFNKNDSKKSQLTLGGYDEQFLYGTIMYTQLISQMYWEIKIDAIFYDNILIIDSKNSPIKYTAVIDTGTSMLAAPFNSFSILDNFLNVETDCSNINLMKNLKFLINGNFYTIEPEYYIFTINDNDKNICLSALMKLDALSDDKKHTFILGMPFLKKYYTVFDIENHKIGFANAKHNLL